MHLKKQISLVRKSLFGVMLLAVLISAFGAGSLSSVSASGTPAITITTSQILSDGQFVYGPNIGNFNIENYLNANTPHLLKYAEDLYGRSEYFSINPKIYLTLLEVHSHLISIPNAAITEDPFGLNNGGFISQIEIVSNIMSDAYYLHLYSYSPLPVSQRRLEPFVTPGGATIYVAPDTNAGTYAIIAGLAAINQQDISIILDNSQANGFYQTYVRLFGNDDPLDKTNHIYTPGEVGVLMTPDYLLPQPAEGEVLGALAAPDNLLQLPYLQGLSWQFGGVHNTAGGTTFTDASALDFYPSGSSWGMNTSNMWVVASASGIPTRVSSCYFKILHNDGWETTYYHLENTQFISGLINQNDKIGVIANTEAEAICNGGSASGPHVHFSLRHNGAFVAINGTPLSGWYVHSGRYSYDVDHNYMWLEKAGVKKYPYSDLVLSEAPPIVITRVISSVRANANPTAATSVDFTVTFSEDVTGVDMTGQAFDDFALTTSPGITGASITGVSGTGAIYTATVNTGSGNGTMRLDVIDNDTILDGAGNPLGGTGIDNGNFTSGEFYKVHKSGGDTVGTFRPSIATFYLRNSNSAGAPNITVQLGNTGDYPVVGDWDGNGSDTIGVYRNGVFYLSNSNTTPHVDLTFAFGKAGDQPIAGDWNGDGIDTIGIYRSSKITFLLRNTNSAGAADATFKLGIPGDVGIAGDWNADGKDSTGVFRPSNGALYFKNANTTGYADIVTVYGIKNDKPVVGDWDR